MLQQLLLLQPLACVRAQVRCLAVSRFAMCSCVTIAAAGELALAQVRFIVGQGHLSGHGVHCWLIYPPLIQLPAFFSFSAL